MKTLFLTVFLNIFVLFSYAIDASISFASFKNGTQSYVEIYTHILGSSVTFNSLNDSTQLQSSVEVLVIFKQSEKIVLADKFNLVSPISPKKVDFVDLKRYALGNGTYELEVQLKDNYNIKNTATYQSGLSVNFSEKLIEQSDIQLVASSAAAKDPQHPFNKHHFYLEPLPYHFYTQSVGSLQFYNEIYAPDLSGMLQVRYFVEQLNADKKKTLKIVHKKRKAKAIVPLLLSMDIHDLPSGNYNLVVEVRDSASELKSRKSVFFQRSNPIVSEIVEEEKEEVIADRFVQTLDAEQLDYSLLALMPILPKNQAEMLNTILKEKNLDIQRNFLYAYWTEQNLKYAAAVYEQYMEVVRAVDKTFKSGFRHGFETDRGHIYLKYGRPDDMVNVQDDPTAPPYEIWSYNDFPQTNQTNIRFLFYNPSLAGGDYILLHSTALGEINNPQWEVQLYRNAPTEIEGDDYFSATKMRSNNARRARQLMEDF